MTSKERTAESLFVTVEELEESDEFIKSLMKDIVANKRNKIYVYKQIAATKHNDLLKFHMVHTIASAIEHFGGLIRILETI